MKDLFKKVLRKLKLAMTALALIASVGVHGQELGQCGDSIWAEFDGETKILHIRGTGRTWDYYYDNTPWINIRKDIKNVILEEGITYIGETFLWDVEYVTNIYLPSTLKQIGLGAFAATFGLKRLILPENVETLTNAAFYGTFLEVLYCLNKIPPKTETGWYSSWYEVDTSNITLYVGSESVDKYKADPGWSGFKEILPLDVADKIERVKGVSLPEKISGRRGDTIRLTEYVKPASAAVKHLFIDYINSNVAKPLQDGSVVLAGNCGEETNITVKTVDGGYTSKSIIRILNDNANLKNLAVKEIQEIEFNSDVIDYHATVGWHISKLSIAAIAENEFATVKLGSQTLNAGNNTIIITVTAEDGSVKNYNLHIYRKNGDARLKSIEINKGSLEPAFLPNTKKYIWRATKKDKIHIRGEAIDKKTSVTGIEYANNGKDTTFIIKTTAEEEKYTETYEVKLKLYNDNALLKSLKVKDFEFEEEFIPTRTNHHVVGIPNDTRQIFIESIAQDSSATITGNIGWQHVTGSENIYSIDVTAEDRITHKDYYIHVIYEGVKTAIEQVEKFYDERVYIYAIDGRRLGTTKRVEKKIIIPDWLGHGIFIAKGSKYREKFTN